MLVELTGLICAPAAKGHLRSDLVALLADIESSNLGDRPLLDQNIRNVRSNLDNLKVVYRDSSAGQE